MDVTQYKLTLQHTSGGVSYYTPVRGFYKQDISQIAKDTCIVFVADKNKFPGHDMYAIVTDKTTQKSSSKPKATPYVSEDDETLDTSDKSKVSKLGKIF